MISQYGALRERVSFQYPSLSYFLFSASQASAVALEPKINLTKKARHTGRKNERVKRNHNDPFWKKYQWWVTPYFRKKSPLNPNSVMKMSPTPNHRKTRKSPIRRTNDGKKSNSLLRLSVKLISQKKTFKNVNHEVDKAVWMDGKDVRKKTDAM